jgi:hypothetical protein
MTQSNLVTLGHLGFEKFNVKDETRPSVGLPFSTFVNTKHSYRSNMPIPNSGAQILEGINQILQEFIPDSTREWGNIYVYKSQFEAPNYVKRLTGTEPEGVKLLTRDTPITDLHFPRFIGTIDLIGDGTHTERIAIKCDDNKTLQLAVGLNVNVCDNFTLFGQNLLTTNTRERRDFAWIMDQIKKYCQSIEDKFKYDTALIKRLEQKEVTADERNRFLGDLLMKYETKEEVLPVTMVTDFSREIKLKEVNNVWQLINAGTERIRFDTNTGDSILETMNSFANHTIETYNEKYEFSV